MSGVTIAKARTRPVVGDSTSLAIVLPIALPGDRLTIKGSDRVNSELDGLSPADVQWAERIASGIRFRAICDLRTDDPFGATA